MQTIWEKMDLFGGGVVEDRKDPLYLGRCKVRILGWHTQIINQTCQPNLFLGHIRYNQLPLLLKLV